MLIGFLNITLASDLLIMLVPPIRVLAGARTSPGALGSYGLSGGGKKSWMLGRHCIVFNWVVHV